MINAEEKEEEESTHEEQKLQIPMDSKLSNIPNDETWNRLPGEPNESLPLASKAMMSYPLGKPKSLSPEMIEIEDKELIDYYIDLAKGQPGKKLAIISKKQGLLLWG